MKLEILLKELIAKDVKLSLKQNQLLIKLPECGVDVKLYNQLKKQKDEVKKIIQNLSDTKVNVSKSKIITLINEINVDNVIVENYTEL